MSASTCVSVPMNSGSVSRPDHLGLVRKLAEPDAVASRQQKKHKCVKMTCALEALVCEVETPHSQRTVTDRFPFRFHLGFREGVDGLQSRIEVVELERQLKFVNRVGRDLESKLLQI